MSLRMMIGAGFLVWQLAMIVNARFIDTKYFCWAPHDSQVQYELTVTINGRELSGEEIQNRYRKAKRGREVRAAGNVKNIIEQYEKTYGRNDRAQVVMKYKVNGIPQRDWVLPSPSPS